jgi:hypothetical protein
VEPVVPAYPPGEGGEYDRTRVEIDLNGDGLVDRVSSVGAPAGYWYVWRNTGWGFESSPTLWPVPNLSGSRHLEMGRETGGSQRDRALENYGLGGAPTTYQLGVLPSPR